MDSATVMAAAHLLERGSIIVLEQVLGIPKGFHKTNPMGQVNLMGFPLGNPYPRVMEQVLVPPNLSATEVEHPMDGERT